MTATHGVGVYGNAVGVVTPLDHKMAQLGLVAKTAANTIRPGVFWDGNATIVSGKANMSYDVRALAAVLSRGATSGAVMLTNDGVFNVVTTAAPGSNSRYDVVYLWQREFSIDGTDSNPVIGVVQGTAAASPTVPSLAAFPGAIALAQILVPAGVTATNTGTTITQTAPFTAAAGGVVTFRNSTERSAGSYQQGQLGWMIDSLSAVVYNGSGWAVPGVTDTGWVTPTILANWTAVGGETPQYRTLNGVTYLRGSAVGTASSAIFLLPVGSRPSTAQDKFWTVNSAQSTSAVARVIARAATGNIEGVSGTTPQLDGISFPADA
ncbi:MAG: hypothetical protein ABIP33_06515 [Pseudolysinimonas sp.]